MNHEYSKIREIPRRRRLKMADAFRIIGGFLILLLAIEGLGILIENFTSRPIVTEWGTMEKGFWADVLFLRDETLVKSPVDGELTEERKDGIRVAEGELIATIKTSGNSEPDPRLQIRLRKLARETATLQGDLKRNGLEYTTKRAHINRISKKSTRPKQLLEDLTFIEQEKRTILRNIEQNRDQIRQITQNFKAWQHGTVLIQTEKPGYFWYQFDEWESRLSPDRFSEVKEEDFQRHYPSRFPEKDIHRDDVIGKIISPFHQIICLIIDPKRIGMPKIGETWWLKSDDSIFQCTVVNQNLLPDGKVLLGLEDASMLSKFLQSRSAKIFIIYKRVSGIIIPVQALYKKGQTDVVKVVKGDSYKETKVVIRENDGVKAIIDGIDYGKTIISR